MRFEGKCARLPTVGTSMGADWCAQPCGLAEGRCTRNPGGRGPRQGLCCQAHLAQSAAALGTALKAVASPGLQVQGMGRQGVGVQQEAQGQPGSLFLKARLKGTGGGSSGLKGRVRGAQDGESTAGPWERSGVKEHLGNLDAGTPDGSRLRGGDGRATASPGSGETVKVPWSSGTDGRVRMALSGDMVHLPTGRPGPRRLRVCVRARPSCGA